MATMINTNKDLVKAISEVYGLEFVTSAKIGGSFDEGQIVAIEVFVTDDKFKEIISKLSEGE